MIKITDIPKMLRELKASYLVIRDSNDERIFTIENTNVETTIKKLQELQSTLKNYGRIYIYGGNKNTFAARMKGAYCWEVVFEDSPGISGAQVVATPGSPELNKRIAELELQIEKSKWEKRQEEKFKELEERFEKKNKKEFNPLMLLPFVGEAIGMKPDKINNIMKMINGEPVTPQTSLAGPGEQDKKLTISMTPEEAQARQDAINKEIGEIFLLTGPDKCLQLMKELNTLHKKTTPDKIITLVEGLNNKPAYVDMAINFLSNG